MNSRLWRQEGGQAGPQDAPRPGEGHQWVPVSLNGRRWGRLDGEGSTWAVTGLCGAWGPQGASEGSPHAPRLGERRLPRPLGVRGCEQALLLSTAAVCAPQPSTSGLAPAPALCWGPQGPCGALSEVGAEGPWGVEGMPGPALAQQGRTTGGWARGAWGAGGTAQSWCCCYNSGVWASTGLCPICPGLRWEGARGSAGRVLGCVAAPPTLD